MSAKKYESIWKDIKPYVCDDRNSLIILFGDKYYGKTEMLKYFVKKDKNPYKYLVENRDIVDGMSLVRICFFKLLTSIYLEDEPQFLSTIDILLKMQIKEESVKGERNYENIFKYIQTCLQECNTECLQKIIDAILTEKVVINFYIGCYQFFQGFDADIMYMNNLNTKISFNFIVATRPYSGEMLEYLGKFSNVKYFELVTKKLEPKTYKIVDEKMYYKMPIYDKFMEESGIDSDIDTNQIINTMNTNEYFKELDDQIGYGLIDSEDLLLMSLIMAAGCLDRHQIDFVFKIVEAHKNINPSAFVKHYEFMWELQGKIFSGSIWGEFVIYNRYNGELKRQLDSFFSSLLYSVFMNVPTKGEEVSIESLRKLLAAQKDYSFFVDRKISEAYQLLLSLAVSYKKHNEGKRGFIANPANGVAVDFLNKYVLAISEHTLDFIIKLFQKTLNFDLLVTYSIAIEKYIRERNKIECNLKIKISEFLKVVFSEADRWSDITLLVYGLKCLDAAIVECKWLISEKYTMTNLKYHMIRKLIRENELCEECMEKFKGANLSVDVLIVVATKDEEEAITQNDEWEECNDLDYQYFVHGEKGITYALVRGTDKGGESAAVAATYFVEKLAPKVIAMVGFAAGREGAVSLGDVVVGYRVFNYDVGKQIGEDIQLNEIDSYRIKDKWKQIAERFGENWRDNVKVEIPKEYTEQQIDLLHEFSVNDIIETRVVYDEQKYPNWSILVKNLVKHNYIAIRPNCTLEITPKGKKYINEYDVVNPMGYIGREPKTQVGVIATGSKVQQWSGIFDKIAMKDRSVCALEMEATAIGKVSSYKEIPFIVVKGIGDYARDGKAFDNRFVAYACQASYRFVVEFFASDEMIEEFWKLN